jgi:hypothetical protein
MLMCAAVGVFALAAVSDKTPLQAVQQADLPIV